jgi:GT2 family glycosyltransferase
MEPFISIVIPTKNNEDLIGNCLRSLKEMDYPKDKTEIIVSDGLSTDRTQEIAKSYEARIVLDHGKSVVSGRNAAFAVARGQLIAISDADCVMDKNWLKNSLKYFQDPKVGGIGGPNLIPEDETAFGKAVGLIFAYAPYVTRAAHTRVLNTVIESRSHGSNAIYRADVLEKVTPVDESLIGGEDVIMNDEIEDLGYKLLYVPDVLVNHYRRPNPRRWWKQMYRYGIGRVLLPRKRKGEVHPIHIIAGLSVPIFLLICLLLAWLNPWLLLWLAGALLMVALVSAVFATVATRSLAVGLNMPLVLAIFFTAWSFGYIHELFFPSGRKREAKKI